MDLPAGAAVGLGALTLGASWLPPLTDRRAGDPVIDPITGREPFRIPRRVQALTWGMPVLMFLLVPTVVLLVPSPS